MDERKTISVEEKYLLSRCDLCGDMDVVIEKLQKVRNDIRSAHRDATNIKMDIDYHMSYYDSCEIDVEVTYDRLETDEEYAKRQERNAKAKVAAAAARKQAKIARAESDRKEWERLKKKFGDTAWLKS